MLTMRPQPRAYMPGRHRRASRNGASSISRTSIENVSGGKSTTAARCCRPALLTRMSTFRSSRSTASRSVRSTTNGRPLISAATSLAPASSRSATSTAAPAAASRVAHARPMPLAPPVTSAVRPPRSTSVPITRPSWPGRACLPAARPAAPPERGGAQPGQPECGRAPHAAPEQEHDGDEDGAGDDPGTVEAGRGQNVLQLNDQGCTQRSTPQRADAAQDDDQHDLARGGPVHVLQGDQAVADGVQAAAQAGERRREYERQQLVPRDRVPECLRAGRVVADGHQHPAERRMHDPPGGEHAEADDRQGRVVEVERVGQVHAEEPARDALQAVLAARDAAPLVGDEVHHLCERERHHGEVNAGTPDRQVPDRHGQRRRGERAGEHRERERHTGMQSDDAGGVGGGTPERGVPERQQAREAEQQVHRDREQRPHRDVHRHRRVDQPGQRERRHRARREQEVLHTRASSRPNRPAGRHNSTAAMRMNTRVCDSAGAYKLHSADATPMPNPATTEPKIEPSPPITTTANTVMMRSAPMSGLTARIGAARTPAKPARATPKPNTGVTQRPTLMPSARVSSGRSVAARTTMPTRLWVSAYHTATQTRPETASTNTW